VLAVASFIVGGDPPDADDPIAEVVEFWSDNDTDNLISALLGGYAGVAFLWFAGCVRANVACVERPGSRLASTSMAGAAVFATGVFVNAALQIIAADTVDDVAPQVTQTLHVMYDGMWFPLAGGLAVFLIAAGLGAIRHGAFDRWLGWIALVLGVLCITPAGFAGFLGGLVWTLIAGVVLYRKADPVGSGAAPPPAGPEAPSAPA
jgi:hypothetical protein